MNKIKYIYILLILTYLSSCVSDEKKIFDDSSTKRINAALSEYNEWLLASEGGWLLEYYPEVDQYGGFYLHLKFLPGEQVEITGEQFVLAEEGEKSVSLYTLKSDTGPLLSFDTFNRVLHQFSDPQEDGIGYGGDYEFIIMDADKDHFELKGKKSDIKMTMTRIADDNTWKEFAAQVNEMVGNYPGFVLALQVGEKEINWSESGNIGRYLSLNVDEDTSVSTSGVPYIYTPTGIKFREAITVDGQTIQNFDYTSTGALICSDEGANAEIIRLPLNIAFSTKRGQWRLDTDRMGPRFTTLWETITERLDTEMDEELLGGYLLNSNQAFAILSYSREENYAFQANFFMEFIPIEEDENQMTILYEGLVDEMAQFFYYKYFITFLSYMSDESPYILTMDSFKTPIEIRFTRTDNPENVWFVVTKA